MPEQTTDITNRHNLDETQYRVGHAAGPGYQSLSLARSMAAWQQTYGGVHHGISIYRNGKVVDFKRW